jgi:DNA-binding MarR family transcriptional regulator
MKNIRPELIRLFKEGYCTPQISRIAKTTNEPSTTIYYNIKKLEKEGAVKTY